MDAALFLLAIGGFLAVLRIAGRAGLLLIGRGVEVFLASEVEANHARRGDLTAMQDAEVARRRARRARFGAAAVFTLAAAALVLPLFSPWPRILYAACMPLWLLLRRRG